MKIKTVHVFPPIPLRMFDWQAYDEDTFDVCSDPECSCRRNALVGWGSTEEEAIQDLMDKMEERKADAEGEQENKESSSPTHH